jgi:hypothetical protein
MNLKETQARNNCAGEGQQQFNRPTDRPNYKQPPRCMLCGGGHLHKECPEKSSTVSIPTCCNCKLVDGEEPHPSSYRGCRHTKEKRNSQTAPRTTTGRMFSSSHTTPGRASAAVLRRNTQQQQQPQPPSVAKAYPASVGEMSRPLP